ncbi:MAG: hypothetical protein CMP21_03760 [Rickettsiales bacterium]|nr:hypothetical protein [Rickettsiales bacterium]|tara:strand:+ start:1888 stop:7437 length:5550 start_codon:yes stop_codon:yes gene_type:complete
MAKYETRKLLTDFNTRPYHDDFDVDKNFLKVLFKPGTALQAREITQLQTILSEQIHRFGNHIFQDGSPIRNGTFNVDVNVKYIKLKDQSAGVDVSSFISELEGRTLVNNEGSEPIIFEVKKAIPKTATEPNTIIGSYKSGSVEIAGEETPLTTQSVQGKLNRTVEVVKRGEDGIALDAEITGPSSLASVVGDASKFIDSYDPNDPEHSAIFYISGFFHRVKPQTIVLDKYGNTPTYRIGLEVDESIVTPADDASLYDNAQGSSNFSAPGADRFKISLNLTKKELQDSSNLIDNNSCDFYEFVRVRNGQKVDQIKNAQYAYLAEEMARRTYDANGDFVVRNFTLDIDEYSQSEVDAAALLNPPVDLTEKLKLTLDPGKAYVHGREIETISTVTLPVDRGRDESRVESENISTFVGNYVYVDFPAQLLTGEEFPTINSNEKLEVFNRGEEHIGSCRIKQLSYDSEGYKLSFFDLNLTSGSSKDIKSFRISDTSTEVVLEVSDKSEVAGGTVVSQQSRSTLLFPISKSSLSDVENVSLLYNKSVIANASNDGNNNSLLSISVNDPVQFLGTGTFIYSSPVELEFNRSNFIIIDKLTGENYDTFSVNFVSNGQANITIPNKNLGGRELRVLYKVQTTIQNSKTKTKTADTIVIDNTDQIVIDDDTGQTRLDGMKIVGKTVPLNGYPDVIKIVSIKGSDNVDIKDRYEFDNGQRDSFYDYASLKLKSGVVVPDSNSFTIELEYFQHPTSGEGFFSKDSYSDVDYEDIPNYFSKNTGKSYSLTDVIDFRPTRDANDNIAGSLIPYGSVTDFLEITYKYFLPRIDKVVVTKDKEFRVIKGTSSDFPVTPPDDPNAMSLYIITVPPYTYNDNDLKVIPIHNRRYTMRDIGILDRRIEELQARSNLRLLQEKSKSVQIRNNNGVDIFKNGILIDDFSGHSIGDTNSSDYRCSIDFETNELRPSFYSDSHEISFDSSDSNNINMVKVGPLLLLEHTEVLHQSQPAASKPINLNPHNMTYWFGEIKMNPSSDMWFSQDLKPRVNVNDSGENDAWENLSTSVSSELAQGFGTQWNDWEDLWTGRENFVSNQEADPSSLVESNVVRLQNRETQNYLFDAVDKINVVGSGLPNRIERDLTSKKIDTSIVPFMRPDEVIFIATNLKPKTTFYGFFDDTALSSPDIEPCSQIVVTNPSKVFNDGLYDGEIITGVDGGTARVVKNANDGSGLIYVQLLTGTFSSNETINGGTSLVQAKISTITTPTDLKSDASGLLCGVLNIPSSETSKFRTGQRLLRLIDNQDNDLSNSESVAESSYTSQGLMDDPENYVVSTRLPLIKRSNICDELSVSKDVFSRELTSINRCLDWKDPLSQTFIVDPASNRNGVFLKSVDLFFKSKDDTLPVMVEIRPTINGYPSTSTVIPFSEVILNPSQVVVSEGPDASEDSNKNTRFTFDAPVYLIPGEYAIVVKTNSSQYQIWSGVVGNSTLNTDGSSDILNPKISKQPLVGSLFSSHNSGVWDAINNESIMFRLNKCQFNTSLESTAILNVTVPSQSESFDLFKFNVSMLKNFFGSQNPTFKYQLGTSNLVEFHENRNIELSSSKSFGGNTTLKIEAKIPASSNVDVSPVIDMERVSLITVGNIVDAVQYDASDLTIQSGGTGFSTGEKLFLTDSHDSSKQAIFEIQATNGAITGFTLLSSSKEMTNSVNITSNTAGPDDAIVIADSETSPSGSVADAVYISKRVNLQSSYESKDIRVYLDLYKPAGTDVYVYYKVASTSDSVIFDDRNWYLMKQVTPEYVVSEYNNDYREYVFGTDSSHNGVELVHDQSLVDFNVYAIKIVLSSDSSVKVPKARNLRAIALQEPVSV